MPAIEPSRPTAPADDGGLTKRAAGAVRQLTFRGGLNRGVSLVGGLVLAALLGPTGFGPFAVGLNLLGVLQSIGAGGMGAMLIRQAEAPGQGERDAVFSFQLLFGSALAALAVGVAVLADDSTVSPIALVVVAAPFGAFKVLPVVLLERDLDYARITLIDLVELGTLYAVAVPLVAAGVGLEALPIAAVTSAAAAALAAAMLRRTRARPSFALGPIVRLWRFGLLFQAAQLLSIVRDWGLSVLLLAFAGPLAAGVWAFAQRLLIVPLTAFQSLWRVGFVVFARLQDDPAGTDAAAQRILRSTAVAACVTLCLVAGPGPVVVREVLGQQWADVQAPVLLAAFGWMISAPITGVLLGLLQAHHRLKTPVATILVQIGLLWVAAIALAPSTGVWIVGLAWLVTLVTDSSIFLIAGRGLVRLDLRPQFVAGLIGVAGAGAAVVAGAVLDGLLAAAVSVVVSVVVLGVGLVTLLRSDVDAVRTVLLKR